MKWIKFCISAFVLLQVIFITIAISYNITTGYPILYTMGLGNIVAIIVGIITAMFIYVGKLFIDTLFKND